MPKCAFAFASTGSILLLIAALSEPSRSEQEPADILQKSVLPAQVHVERASPIRFGSGQQWQNAPRYLQGATIYEADENANYELNFQVLEDGVVLLAASFISVGTPKKGWHQGRTTGGMLMRDGWHVIVRQIITTQGDKPDPHFLYKRVVKKGQTFTLHTRGDRAPLLIVPAIDKVADVLAAPPLAEIQPSGMPRWKRSQLAAAGKASGSKSFVDDGGRSAVLVGFNLTHDFASQRRGICSVQPIYEQGGVRRAGEAHGKEGATTIEIHARPDYAVGAIVGSTDGEIDGLRVIFMRRIVTGLDTNDTFESRWVGSRTNASEGIVGGDGRLFRGIRGTATDRLRSLQLIAVDE